MGCDGGTIPTRDELVKTKKKPEQVIKLLLYLKIAKILTKIMFYRKIKIPSDCTNGDIVL